MFNNALGPRFLLIAILTQEFRGSWSKITVSLKFLTYENTFRCGRRSGCARDFSFSICLSGRHPCFHTGTFYDKSSITFADDMQSVSNPVLVDFPDGAEVDLSVSVTQIRRHRANPWDDFFLYRIARPMPRTKQISMRGHWRETRLTIELFMYCTPPFYPDGETCTKYCQSIDNNFGHYTCKTNGDKECLPDWFDPNTNCTTHRESCQVTQCQNGGTCLSNGVCNCHKGYTGTDCSDQVNRCTMSACIDENTASCENLHGSYICHCEPGYTGEQCETPATESPATDEQVGPHSPKTLGLPIGLFIGLLLLIIVVVILIVFVIRWRKRIMKKETDAPGTATLGMERGPHSTESNEAHSNPYVMDESTFTNNNLPHEAERGTLPTHGIHSTPTSHTGVPALPPYRVTDIPGPRDGIFLVENGNYESTGNIGRNTYDNVGMR